VALLAGQYAAGKTFVGLDLAASVLTGVDFAHQEVCRRGGVLWLAAEGAAEVDARLSGTLNGKLRTLLGENAELNKLAFACQKLDVPLLTGRDAETHFKRLIAEAREVMASRFQVELALIIIDTMAAAAGFEDENSASETQKVMNLLRSLSRSTETLVVAIDHFGKMIETGIRGSSAKSAAADTILAVLADKEMEGEIRNRRLAVAKLRTGPAGGVFPFDLIQTPIGGTGETTCFVKWRSVSQPEIKKVAATSPWRGRTRYLGRAMQALLGDHGHILRPFGENGVEILAVELNRVRGEFLATVSIGSDVKPDAKRKAFQRAIDDATGKGLVEFREIEGRDWLWFTSLGDQEGQYRPDSRTNRTAPIGALSCPSRGCDEDSRDKCPPCPVCPDFDALAKGPVG